MKHPQLEFVTDCVHSTAKFVDTQVNHPHLIGVGMSREGYGQQVDKEA